MVDSLVLSTHDTMPPSKWALDRLIETYTGSDAHVRSVKVRTATTTLKRSIVKIFLLSLKSTHSTESTHTKDNVAV